MGHVSSHSEVLKLPFLLHLWLAAQSVCHANDLCVSAIVGSNARWRFRVTNLSDMSPPVNVM